MHWKDMRDILTLAGLTSALGFHRNNTAKITEALKLSSVMKEHIQVSYLMEHYIEVSNFMVSCFISSNILEGPEWLKRK